MSQNNAKYLVIALFGESGSGKDFVLNEILSRFALPLHEVTHTTTRPIREYEINHIHYHFVSLEEFTQLLLSGKMIEATVFGDENWGYGTTQDEYEQDWVNIGIYSPEAIECLLENPQIEVIPVRVFANPKTRLIRQLEREDSPNCKEVCRRFLSDCKDFENIAFDYLTYDNNNNHSRLDEATIQKIMDKIIKSLD